MMIKDLGARVENAWKGLRPLTKKMLAGAIEANPSKPNQKPAYDAHADWEISRLLSALDEQTEDTEIKKDAEKLHEIKDFADTCARVLEAQTELAEVFIQLAKRAVLRQDYEKLDRLADTLAERFAATEIAEIVRQTDVPHIRAIAYETLALVPTAAIVTLLEDPLYFEIARNALEQQAFEYDNEEARLVLEQIEFEDFTI